MPFTPYAVMIGMPGYMPNSCDHFATLRSALDHYAEELERAIDHDIDDSPEHTIRSFMCADLEVIQTALRASGEPIHPEHDLTKGYSSRIGENEWLTYVPIAARDYEPNRDGHRDDYHSD
jgi:hypothetical protein